MIRQILESRGIRSGAVGLDIGLASGISPGELDVLRRELDGFDLRDASKLFWRLRMIKTPAEIACMRRAVEIQNTAFKSFCGRISRNMTESDLIFEMLSCQREAGANEIGMVLSTTHPTGAIFGAQISGRSMQPGDLQWFDAGATYNGYTCDFDILIAWGDATADQIKTHAQLKDVYQEAMEAWRPGRPVAEIAWDTRQYSKNMAPKTYCRAVSWVIAWVRRWSNVPWFGTRSPKGLRLEPGMIIAPGMGHGHCAGKFPVGEKFLGDRGRLGGTQQLSRRIDRDHQLTAEPSVGNRRRYHALTVPPLRGTGCAVRSPAQSRNILRLGLHSNIFESLCENYRA